LGIEGKDTPKGILGIRKNSKKNSNFTLKERLKRNPKLVQQIQSLFIASILIFLSVRFVISSQLAFGIHQPGEEPIACTPLCNSTLSTSISGSNCGGFA